MSQRKRETLEEEDDEEEHDRVKYRRTKPRQSEELSPPKSPMKPTERNDKTGGLNERENEVAIGCSIRPDKTVNHGTVGPFVRIKETQDLCFLTARNIFGPFQHTDIFKGTPVYLTDNYERIADKLPCGETVSDELSENMDAVLVMMTKEYKTEKPKFIDVETRQMERLGFQSNYLSLYGNTGSIMDARGLTVKDVDDNYKLIKVGSGTGLTQGIFHFTDGVVKSDSFFLQRQSHDGTFTQFITYREQILVHSVEDDVFADKNDVGAGVYLVDKNNMFHCIGVVLCKKDDGFLITPIQEILTCLGKKIGQTLEFVTFDSQLQKVDNEIFDPKEREIFDRALRRGTENDKNIRINIIGFYAQGKTSLTKRLLQEPLQNLESTDGIDVHIRKCKVKKIGKWEIIDTKQGVRELFRRLVLVSRDLNDTPSDDELDLTKPPQSDQTNSEYEFERNRDMQTGSDSSPRSGQPENTNSDAENECSNDNNLGLEYTESETCAQKQNLLRHFIEESHKIEPSAKNDLIATIWDFGGQYIYYTTHQIFHSRDAIYLLVFNLNKDLDNVIEDCDFPGRQEQMKNSLMFWVNSINTYVGTNDCTQPIVILVGTHKNTFQGNLEAKFTEVKDLFAGTEVRKHIFDKTFAVDNSSPDDSAIEELRYTIYNIGKQKAKAAKRLPASWIHLEMSLLEKNQRDILSFKEILHLTTKIDFPQNTDELKVFLKYHHDKGTLVYFDEQELGEYVILNPQFLIDAFRCIITSKAICDGCPKLHDLRKRMTNMAILEKELLDAVWSKNQLFSKFSNIILKFLIRHRILAEILKTEGHGAEIILKGTQNYIIPSFLQVSCPDKTTKTFINGRTCSSVILGLSLRNNVMISTFYERVLAAVLGNFPPIEFRDQVLVFQNLAYILLNRRHAGRIQNVENEGLELMVIRLVESDEDLNAVCDDFRRKVETAIQQEFKKLQNNMRQDSFNHYIKCNDNFHESHGSKKSYVLYDIKNDITVVCPDNEKHGINIQSAIVEWFQNERTLSIVNGEHAERLATDHDLSQIAQALGCNWELLAVELDVSSDKVQRIKMEHQYSGEATKIFHVLKEWKDQDGKKKFLSHLIKALRKNETVVVNWEKIRNITDKVS